MPVIAGRSHSVTLPLLAFLLATLALFIGCERRALATDLVRIRLDTTEELPPKQVCILSDFSADANAEQWATSALASAQPADQCARRIVDPKLAHPALAKLRCTSNTSQAVNRLAVLHVRNAAVTSIDLDGTVVRLSLTPSNQTQTLPSVVHLLGGDYHEHEPLSFRQLDGTQLLELPLVPRCVERDVVIPDHYCGSARGANDVVSISRGAELDTSLSAARRLRARVHNPMNGNGELVLEHCGQAFSARWIGTLPPRPIQLNADTFWFEWQRNCLAPAGECPEVRIQGATILSHPHPDKQNVCRYQAGGSASFPTEVHFSYHKGSLTLAWHETLSGPGYRLLDYIPADQRRIFITWPPDLKTRSARPQDALEYVELRTPEGREHRVPLHSAQIRVPELDCEDALSYHYVGTRVFLEQDARVAEGGMIELSAPDDSRADSFAVGIALGGGLRYIGGTERGAWGPHGTAQVILIFRQPRDWLEWSRASLDLNVVFGAQVGYQPFCSQLMNGVGDPTCYSREWTNVSYWHLPVTAGPHLHLASNFNLGVDGGFALTTAHLSKDAGRVHQRVLGTLRTHIGYQISRAMSFEVQAYWYFGERVREVRFDDAGVTFAGDSSAASSVSISPGLMLRLDDVL